MSGISQNEGDELKAIVDKHINALSEHFDCVHIFVNRAEGDKQVTRALNRGGGNWFARYGQIREWVVYEEERMRVCARESEKASE